ncbi:hypothetical protein [Sessilibacter corallicola]|uniref:Uncharacterized protein n=1 Tax=Sessilibacter corallicola TaxID=2904075 RepID=A0ABQ0ACW2_9GAMM
MIYTVKEDNSNYLQPFPMKTVQEYGDDPAIFKQVSYLCHPGSDKYHGQWKPMKIFLEPEGKNLPTADASGMSGKLFFTEKTLTVLAKNLAMNEFFENPDFGEFVEVFYDDNGESVKGFFFNPAITLESQDIAVDTIEDQYANTLSVTPRTHDFPAMLFKTEKKTGVYCTQVFKDAFVNSNLTGLIFKETGHQIEDSSTPKLS